MLEEEGASDDSGAGSPPTLLEQLSRNALRSPAKSAASFLLSSPDGGKLERTLTYGELESETDTLARRILDLGIKPGDRVALVYPPSLDFMVAFLSCLKAGIIAVPVFPPNPARRDTLMMFSRIVEGCGAKHALTCRSYNHAKKLGTIKDAFGRFKRPANAPSWPENIEWIVTDISASAALSRKSSKTVPTASPPARSDVAFLQYTSGSTSEPKGVMITHGNLAHNLHIITSELGAVDDTVVVSWLPQYHDMGLIGSYLGVLYCGGSGYYLSPLSFLQRPMVWIEAVSKYKATHLQAPNFAFKLTARKFDSSKYGNGGKLDLSSVRHIINAAEPVDEESIDAFYSTFERFGLRNDVIFPTYGLAEHTVFVCSGGKQRLTVRKKDLEVDGAVREVDPDGRSEASTDREEGDRMTTRLVGCGYPAHQNIDVRIVDAESLEERPEDEVGEIWVRSPSKAAGYYNKPTETKVEFRAIIPSSTGDTESKDDAGDNDEDPATGYLRTGDLGFLHARELFICGRLKDLIIVGGRNYYPQDIEATIEGASDAIRPGCSAAFSVDPIGKKGDEEVAVVAELREVPKKQDVEKVCNPIIETLRSAVNQEHLLGLSYIVLVRTRTIDKTTSGKIARAWCRKAFVNDTLHVVHQRSFTRDAPPNGFPPLEIDQTPSAVEESSGNASSAKTKRAHEIRTWDNAKILKKLVADVARLASMPLESIDTKAALITTLDSLTISQFKGLLEADYAVTLSDEYLFREDATLEKLVEVVKLGYAPDDTADTEGRNEGGRSRPASSPGGVGGRGGLAGALGCPPGVVCCVVM